MNINLRGCKILLPHVAEERGMGVSLAFGNLDPRGFDVLDHVKLDIPAALEVQGEHMPCHLVGQCQGSIVPYVDIM